MGYQLETKALISKENYNALRIRRIMLILEKVNIHQSICNFKSHIIFVAHYDLLEVLVSHTTL